MARPVKTKRRKLRAAMTFILSAAMVFETVPCNVFAATRDAIELQYVTPEEDTENAISIGTLSTAVEERGSYILTFVRNNSEGEASFKLKTVDISAKYGEDYVIEKSFSVPVKNEKTKKTILEQSADLKEQEKRMEQADEEFKDVDLSEAAEAIESGGLVSMQQDGSADEISDDASAEEDTASASTVKSKLAVLKEKQTGKATRDITSTTTYSDPIESTLFQANRESLGDLVESSSTTELKFEDGEKIKQVTFKVLEDNISEGDEAMDFIISDASDGWNLGSSVNCTITITDDEEVVHSKLSFSKEKFSSEDGTAEIKIKRTGAEYSLVTATLRTVQDGSAIEGQNYEGVSQNIEFAPYVNEQTVSIPVYSEDKSDFSVEICDIKGGEAGDSVKSQVNIIPDKNSEGSKLSASLLASDPSDYSGYSSFNITLDGKTYRVYYKNTESVGYIVDTSYTPEVTVGRYYFPYPGNINSGTFQYGTFSGEDDCTDRQSKYVSKGAEDCDVETGAGYLYWYNWWKWATGSAYFTAAKDTFLNTTGYQYVSADWHEASSFGGTQHSTIYINKNGSSFDRDNVNVKNEFKRTMSEPLLFIDNKGKPVDKDINLKFEVKDPGNSTPKNKLYVYGVAAMYKKFNITLQDPDKMEFYNGNGNTRWEVPANVRVKEGHSTRYFGQEFQIEVTGTSDNSIYGMLDHYEITVGEGQNTQKFDYKPSGTNITSISFDENFIKEIDKHTPAVTRSGNSFYTKLSIKPVFKYIDTIVNVTSTDKGSFKDTNLSVGRHSFHVGDKLNMDGVSKAEGYDYVGYHYNEFKNASDTVSDEYERYKRSSNDNDFTVILTKARYDMYPVFTQSNYIAVKLTDKAKKYLDVSPIKTKDDKSIPTEIKQNMEANDIEYVLITDWKADSNKMDSDKADKEDYKPLFNPEAGKVYTIEARSKDDTKEPVYTVSGVDDFKAVGSAFDFVLNSVVNRTVITIDVKDVDPSEKKLFQLDGYTVIPFSSIRDSAIEGQVQRAEGISLTAGGEYIDLGGKYILSRTTDSSDSDGCFELKGVMGYDGDNISIKVSNGDYECVKYVTLAAPKGMFTKEITYMKPVAGTGENAGTLTEKPVTADCYVNNIGQIDMALRSALAPYVDTITYEVDTIYSASSEYQYDTRNNEIAILNTYINIKANVVRNGRAIKAAVFRTVHKNGSYEDNRVDAKKENVYNQNEFIASYKLDTSFEPGDMLYISLIDNEDDVYHTTYKGDDGKSYDTTFTSEKQYYFVFTGLTFYVPTLDADPQTFDVGTKMSVNVPLLGEVAPSQKTGGISLNKTYYGAEGEPNRPYTLSFYFSPGYSTIAQNTAATTLNNIMQGATSATEKLKADPVDEHEGINKSLQKLLGEKDNLTPEEMDRKYAELGFRKSLSNISKKVPFDVHALLLLSYTFLYDNDSNKYVMVTSQYCLGGMISVARCMYTTIYGLPVFLKISGSLGLNYSGMTNPEENDYVIDQYTFSTTSNVADLTRSDEAGYFTITAALGTQVGAGLCGVVGARGIVNINISSKVDMDVESFSDDSDGFLFKLGGGFAIDMLLFSIEYTPSIATYGAGCYKKVAENSDSIFILSDSNGGNIREINNGTSDMSSFGSSLQQSQSGNNENSSVNVLLKDARERTKPVITTLSDGRKFMVFLANSGEEAPNNSALMYSVYDDGKWSKPENVDGDGTSDVYPQLIKFTKGGKEKVAVIWSDANKKFEELTAEKDVLDSLEIACRIYDVSSGKFGEKYRITNDDFMDTGASFCYDEVNNKLLCYYVKRDLSTASSIEELADIAATYSTVAYRELDLDTGTPDNEEKYLDILHGRLQDPLVIDFSAASDKIGDDQYLFFTYTVDEDKQISTSDDREVYLVVHDRTTEKQYYPIQITNNSVADTHPELVKNDGYTYLSWLQDSNKLKMLNVTGIIEQIKAKGLDGKYFTSDENDRKWYIKRAEDLGMDAEEYSDSIFEKLANKNAYSFEKDFNEDGRFDRAISDYQILSDNDKNMYLLWTEAGYTSSNSGSSANESAELYGAVLENDRIVDASGVDGTASYKGGFTNWSNSVQMTDLGKYIDEFNAAIDDEGNIVVVSNMYSQHVNEKGTLEVSPNALVEIELNKKSSLRAENIEISNIPRAGAQTNITFDVLNAGLCSSSGYDIEVNAVSGGSKTAIYSETVDKQLVSGYSDSCTVEWNVADDTAFDKIEINVKDKSTGKTTSFEEAVKNGPDVKVTDEKAQFNANGELYISGTIKNEGNKTSGAIAFKAAVPTNKEKVYGAYEAAALAPGESREFSYKLENFSAASDLNKYGFCNIANICSVSGEEVNTNVIMAAALRAVDLTVDNYAESISLRPGQAYSVSAKAVPSNIADKTIAYTSSDNGVVTVSDAGVITPAGNGEATVTIQHISSGISKTVKVTVSGFTPDGESSGGGSSGGGGSSATPSTPTTPETKPGQDPGETAFIFSDVSTYSWYAQYVKFVSENEIFKGVSEDRFGPDVDVTRGMIATVLGRMENIDVEKYSETKFSDVDMSAYYAPYIAWLEENGIVSGFGDDTFRPDQTITREQLAKIITGYMEYKEQAVNKDTNALAFSDNDQIAEWAQESVANCVNNKLIQGDDKGCFNPKSSTTRAQLAAIITRMMDTTMDK